MIVSKKRASSLVLAALFAGRHCVFESHVFQLTSSFEWAFPGGSMDRRGRQCHLAKTIINDEGVGSVLSLHFPSFRIKGHPLSSHPFMLY